MIITPEELRQELGITGPPDRLPLINDLRAYFGVTVQENPQRSGSIIMWRPGDKLTITLGRTSTLERKREEAAHEFGHVACEHVGPERVALFSRGNRQYVKTPPWIEDEADEWGRDYLIGRGALGIQVNHVGTRSVSQLASLFKVNPSTITRAATDYRLAHLLVRDEVKLARFYQSPAWHTTLRQLLTDRPICERPACGRRSTRGHHTRYDRYWKCLLEDLEALCWDCHADTHFGTHHPDQLSITAA